MPSSVISLQFVISRILMLYSVVCNSGIFGRYTSLITSSVTWSYSASDRITAAISL